MNFTHNSTGAPGRFLFRAAGATGFCLRILSPEGRCDPETTPGSRPPWGGNAIIWRIRSEEEDQWSPARNPYAIAVLTASGRHFLDDVGVRLPGGRRPLIRYCIDWTETRHRLAGQLGRALRDHVLQAGWIEQRPASRALRITPAGAAGIEESFGLRVEAG